MKNKTSILTIIFALFISVSIFSQHRESRKKIKALKISYITEKLNLSEKEAAKFWPVYNKFEKGLRKNYHEDRAALKKQIDASGGIDNISEKQAKSFAKKMLALEKGEYELHEKFHFELSKIISYKKITKLQIVEREFNRSLFRRFKKQKTRKLKKENK